MKKPLHPLLALLAAVAFDMAAWALIWWAAMQLRSLVWLLVVIYAELMLT